MRIQRTQTFEKIHQQLHTLGDVCKIKRCDFYSAGMITQKLVEYHDDEECLLLRVSMHDITAAYNNTAGHFFEPMYQVSLKAGVKINLNYILAVINARISQFFIQHICQQEIAYGPVIAHVRQLPIKNIDFTNQRESDLYYEITKNADFLVKLTNELKYSGAPHKTSLIYGQITYHQKRINYLMYQLHNLNPEEINLIEG